MSKIRDPKGREMHCVLLQVLTKNAMGQPQTLRLRQDHETVDDLGSDPHREFHVVWTSGDQLPVSSILNELYGARDTIASVRQSVIEAERAIASLQRELSAVREDCEQKTIELRLLTRERDPQKFVSAVTAEVDRRTQVLKATAEEFGRRLADKDRVIAELRESKRRLKEANERLKEKR